MRTIYQGCRALPFALAGLSCNSLASTSKNSLTSHWRLPARYTLAFALRYVTFALLIFRQNWYDRVKARSLFGKLNTEHKSDFLVYILQQWCLGTV